MASVVVTIKIMPTSPDVDLDNLYNQACTNIRNFVDEKHKEDEIRKQLEPIGFGLQALKLVFVMDESLGDTEKLEQTVLSLEQVESVEVTDVRRAIG
ncbi:elongation factor 1-beta [Candidatus Woesearchaeota archaeon CG10_big_fil_rev_8_21_14_0_10_37_12]|nr:MAG: elongation factor 1-beta [Candidatus Woesearchaeota archaeon CG10_big_fil_rev_8_21_14_0_10_37_12]